MNDLVEVVEGGRESRKLLNITVIRCLIKRRVPFDKLTSTDSSDDERLLRMKRK